MLDARCAACPVRYDVPPLIAAIAWRSSQQRITTISYAEVLMATVFISYSHRDKPFVSRLARDLEQEGHRVWIDQTGLAPGHMMATRIANAIQQAEIFIPVVSEASLASDWTQAEINLAMVEQNSAGKEVVVPVLLDSVEPPGFLKGLHYADFRPRVDYRKALGHLLNAIARLSSTPSTAAELLPMPRMPYFAHGTVEFLLELYGESALLTSDRGQVYPIAVVPSSAGSPDDILGEVVRDERTFPVSTPYLEFLEAEAARREKHLWNGRTFSLRSVNWGPTGPRVSCSVNRYYDAINTCDVLEAELRDALLDASRANKRSSFMQLYATLPLRHAVHDGATGVAALESAWSCRRTSAAIAVSTLLVVNTGPAYRYYVRRRSTSVAVHADLYHVVPSFMFQPTARLTDEHREFSVTHNVLREFAEEVFSKHSRVGTESSVDPYDHFYSMPQVRSTRALLNNGGAELKVTGLALNLLNLRPEILTVLVIHNSDWFEAHKGTIRFCREEFSPAFLDDSDLPEFMASVDLADDSVLRVGAQFSPESCVAPGAACLIQGLPVARALVELQ
jgi:TIR domain-containing protein